MLGTATREWQQKPHSAPSSSAIHTTFKPSFINWTSFWLRSDAALPIHREHCQGTSSLWSSVLIPPSLLPPPPQTSSCDHRKLTAALYRKPYFISLLRLFRGIYGDSVFGVLCIIEWPIWPRLWVSEQSERTSAHISECVPYQSLWALFVLLCVNIPAVRLLAF